MEKGNKFTVNLVKKTSAVAALLACVGSVLIFFFNDQSVQQTYVAITACIVLSSLAFYTHTFPNHKYNGLIFILVIMMAILAPMAVSGGVHSRFIVMVPVLPMMMFLMLDKKTSYTLTVLMVTYIIGISVFSEHLIDLTGSEQIVRETFPRTLWLLIATMFSLAFTIVFADINSKLTMQLQASEPDQKISQIINKETAFRYASNLLLKLKSKPMSQQMLSVFVLEPYVLVSNVELTSEQSNKIKNSLHKVFRKETDIIGYLDNKLYMACQPVYSREKARKNAELLQQNLRNSDLNFYIGYIVVDAKIGIDIQSIVSLASMALAKSKTQSIPHIVDYSELKNLR